MEFLKSNINTPLSFVQCGHFIGDKNWSHMKRIIDNFEIIIGVKGTAYIQQDDERFEVQPGRALLLLPGHIHQGYASSEEGTSFYWVHFLCREEFTLLDEKEAMVEVSPLKSNPYFNRLKDSILIPTFSPLINMEKILIQFNQLLHISNSHYYSAHVADYLLTFMLMELTQLIIDDTFLKEDSSQSGNRKFAGILEWIRINIEKELSVQEISEKFNVNADYLARMFKKHLGISPMKYINGMKISKAKELLYETEENIKEISYGLGFKDEKYFMKLFKLYEKMTPTEYRNAYYKTYMNNK